jgi:hypothetical protein
MMFTPPEPIKKEPRRIVQIAPLYNSYPFPNRVYALCNDGTVWNIKQDPAKNDLWEQLPEIPQ